MKSLFVDTSAWYALVDRDDGFHAAAREFLLRAAEESWTFVTSNQVLGETYTLIRTRLGYRQAWEFLDRVRASRRVERVFVEERIEGLAYELLRQNVDEAFSFVDGTSFVTMRERGLEEAFAFDRHFSMAGCGLLPTSSASI